jgi:preprotein translocase subunit SecG
MTNFVTVIHIITCVLIILVVLMQSGKGAEISASLGGSSNTVFGSSGGANFFTKTTFVLAAIFMITSLGLTILGGKERRSVFDTGTIPTTSTAPVAPTGDAAAPAPTAENANAPAPGADPAKK